MISGFNLRSSRGDEKVYSFFEQGTKGKLAGISIVYGSNGSGKTTLARALGSKEEERPESVTVNFDVQPSEDITQIRRNLYNEKFILDKFRVFEDEVGALVLLGDEVDHVDAVEALVKENEELQESIEKLKAEELVIGKSGAGSIKAARADFTKALSTAGWANNFRTLTQRESMPKYLETTLDEIISVYKNPPADFEIEKSRKELLETLETFQRAAMGGKNSTIDKMLQSIDLSVDEEKINRTLKEVPPRVDGDKLVEAVTASLRNVDQSGVTRHARKLIVDEHAEQCPLCFQTVQEPHRQLLKDALRKVYNEDRANLEQRLETLKDQLLFPVKSLEHEVESILPKEISERFTASKKQAEEENLKIQASIEDKINELESPASIDLEPLLNAIQALNSCIENVNELIMAHNEMVQDLEEVAARALKLNDLICGYDARNELQEYERLKNYLKEVSGALEQSRSKLEKNSAEIHRLRSETNNTTDAVKLVNSFLRIIFAETDRLTIAPAKQGYTVSCHGVRLKPGALSTGERNILSLAYFFASVFTSISDYNNPKEHRLVVLDDPLSSFDEDNRYGVLLLIKQMADRIASKGNGQLIFFTHDARLVFNLNDAFKSTNDVVVATWKLSSRELIPLKLNDSNKYKTMLERILRFALLGTLHSPAKNERDGENYPEADLIRMDIANVHPSVIPTGNEVRQVLEAFSEFNYGTDISNLMTNRIVKAALKHTGDDFSEYFGGSIYKLVLHGESHTGDSVKVGDFSFTPLAKDNDRVHVCREVICLISVLAPDHVASRLNLSRKNKNARELPDSDELEEYLHDWKLMIEDRALPTL